MPKTLEWTTSVYESKAEFNITQHNILRHYFGRMHSSQGEQRAINFPLFNGYQLQTASVVAEPNSGSDGRVQIRP